jgi:uncharacterized protein (TIGR01732 family)
MRKEGDKMSGFCGGYGGGYGGCREREYVECERGYGGRGSSFALIVVLFILLIIIWSSMGGY